MKKGIFNTIFVLLLALAVNAQTPVAEFSASVQSGCSPLSIAFRDLSTGDPKYWNWDFGNGQLSNLQNPTATFSTPGTYTVTLVVRNQNGVNAITKTDYITVFPSPSVGLSANITTACLPAPIQFTGTASTPDGTITSYAWDFGDGNTSTQQNPSHVYEQTGYYSISLTATSSNGCVGRTSRGRYIRMVGGIEAEFLNTPSPECQPPFNVAFTNESSGPGTLTYEWDFGNGNTSTNPNPVASFNTNGNYNVLLTTRSNFGCVDTVRKTVSVNSFTTDFNNPDTVCIGQQFNFQNTSAAGIVSFSWNFGDGTGSAEVSPTKTYSTPGNYNVKLVNRFSSCTDSLEKIIVVTGKPAVDFTATNQSGCQAPLNVSFQANAPTATSWQWDFGDGAHGTGATPQHTYNAAGEYNVTLTITTAGGCENSVTKNQFVRIVAPTVSITNSNASGCAPLNVTPTANVNAIDGVTSYAWDLGNGNTSSSATPSTNYATAGNYTISVTITTTGGCTATATSTVRAGTPPSAVDFTASSTGDCISDPVSFQGTATGANEWNWDFGDGESSTLQNPTHTYTDTGRFDVSLTALNNGCPAPAVTKNNIIFKQAPVANFGFNLDCINRLSVTFSDSSIVDPALGNLSYDWNFGDGNSSTAALPGTYTYAQYGTYTVRLTVTNGGCTSSINKTITVAPLDSTFSVSKNPLCRDERVTFTALESTANVQSYLWSLNGGGNFNNGTGIVDTSFNTPGNPTVRLTVIDRYNCVASSTQTLTITGPNALFNTSSLAACKNGTVTFTDQSAADVGIASWAWDFGDGQTQSFTSAPFAHTYTDTGLFVAKLRVTDNAGCTHEYVSDDTIRITNPVASFGTANQLYCPGLELPFRDSSSGYTLTYDWNFGDGQISADQHPLHTYTSEGTYTVKLVITDEVGCKDSATKANYISVRQPVAAFTVEDSASTCQLLETKFYHTSQNYESLLWDFGDGIDSRLDQPMVRHFYDDFGNYTAKLYARGYGGCVDSASYPINVYNPNTYTQINYTAPPYACNELTVDFNFTVPPNTKYYFYFGDGSIDSSGQKTLQHTYNYPNTYRPSVFMIDSVDCRTQVSGPLVIDIRGPVPAFNLDRRAFCDSGTVFATNFTISRSVDPVVSQSWNFGGTIYTEKDPPPHSFTQAGLYPVTLSATTATGCTLSYSDTVRVPRTPQPLINADDLTCVNRAVRFDGTLVHPDTAIVWNWNFGDGRTSVEQNNTIVYERPGEYNIDLTTANFLNCSGTTRHPFTVAPLPVITTTPATMPVGGQIQLPVTYSPGIASYVWTPSEGLSCTNCPNPVARPQFNQTYTVSVTDSNSCVSSADITVTVLCTEENYFVPNTFSPNGDGMNDVFYPRGRGLARVQSMRIYNRWGQQVFERKSFMANDASMGWNGRSGTQALPPDVYVYIVEFVCDNAQIVPMKGNVTLIR